MIRVRYGLFPMSFVVVTEGCGRGCDAGMDFYGRPTAAMWFNLPLRARRRVAVLRRRGRGRRVQPAEGNYRATIWGMKKLGVDWIISVSAVGSRGAR